MKAIVSTAVLLICQPADSPCLDGPVPATLTVPGFRYVDTRVNGKAKKNLIQVVPNDAVLVVPTPAEATLTVPSDDPFVRNWILTEMSCYKPMKRTPAHIRMWGQTTIFASTSKELRGHWIKVVTIGSGEILIGPVIGSMPRHRPSRYSGAKHRMLDVLEPGWTKAFGNRPLGVVDVRFCDLGVDYTP